MDCVEGFVAAVQSREAHDTRMKKIAEDVRMRNNEMPFNGSRPIHGGFQIFLNEEWNKPG